jgi:hypothetical protein
MKPTKMAALLMAGMALVGMTYSAAGQKASAHNFSEDESASFLVDVMAAKVHLMLVGRNLDNPDAALSHIDHVHMIISDEMLNEIAERNERIAEDIPAALDDLATMIEGGEDRGVIVGQFREINNLLAEAVSVRIDSDHVKETHVRALIVAGLVDNVLTSYEQAYGMGEHMMGEGHEAGGEIVDHDAYIAARTFAILAKNTFLRGQLEVKGSEAAHDAKAGLTELKEAVQARHSVEDVTVVVHIGVHPKLQDAFGLEIAGHAGSNEHMEEGEHMDGDSAEG